MVKRRTLLVLDGVVNGTDNSERISSIDDAQFRKYAPKRFYGPESIEVTLDKQYETTCLLISQKTGLSAKDMTVLSYYNALSVIEKQMDAEAKAGKPINKR